MSSNRTKINKQFLQKKRSLVKSNEIENLPKKQVLRIKMGPWDEKEDEILRQWVEKNGAYNWTKCADYMKVRTAKQCREHWKNSLDSNLKVGDWSAEEDLLIMKFYKKYESWRKMIPMFEGRTENSIKNRFFSQLRKIVVKKRPHGKKEYGTKFGLDILKTYLEDGIKQAEKRYYEENKNITKEMFENYMMQIENSINNRKKGKKFIDLESVKRKNINFKKKKSDIININEDEEEEEEQINKSFSLEEKDENLETFNNNTNKKRCKKIVKNNIFKTVKNTEELNTREETITFKDNFNFKRNNSKSKINHEKIINEENIIKEEDKIETNELNEDNKNDNLDSKKTISKKTSKKYEEEKKKENHKNQDPFIPPKNFDYYEFKITPPPKNTKFNRSESLKKLNEVEEQKPNNIPSGLYRGTTKNIHHTLKGKYMSLNSFI